MLTHIVDRLGEFNPQTFRELKSKINSRNIIFTVGLSIAIQLTTFMWFALRLPPQYLPKDHRGQPIDYYYNDYCINGGKYGHCDLDSLGQILVNWDRWWQDLFLGLSWVIPAILIIGGIYLLISDLEQEEKRGTLNFIRLSPQAPEQIFIGKLIGIPSLVYLGIALSLPLHWMSAVNAQLNLGVLFTWYLAVFGMTFACYLTAILYVLLGGRQAILTTGLVSFCLFLPGLLINHYIYSLLRQDYSWESITKSNINWFGIPVGSNIIVFYAFIGVTCSLACLILWQAINRRYLNPTATVINKAHSYLITFLIQGYLIGFSSNIFNNLYTYASRTEDHILLERLSFFFFCNFVWFIILMPAIIPTKQKMIDWSRYHHLNNKKSSTNSLKKGNLFIQQLLFDEHSPAVFAYTANLLIAAICWLPIVIMSIKNGYLETKVLLSILVAISLMVIYASIAQSIMFSKFRKRQMWSTGIVGATIMIPIVLSIVSSGGGAVTGISAIFLLFSPILWTTIHNVTVGVIFFSFASQLVAIAGLNIWFNKQLNQLGQSQTKAMISG